MNYTVRNLKTKDLFALSKILDKMDLKIDPKSKISGTELMMKFLKSLHLAEDETNTFFASLIGITAQQFSDLDIEEVSSVIEQFKDKKGLASFFGQAKK